MYYVYVHTTPNGKKYVGLTTQRLERRWRGGKGYKNNKYFSRAIMKYGWDNIEHTVYSVDTEKEMFYLEKYLISYYNTTNPNNGYNLSTGGESGNAGCGTPHTKEWREHLKCSGNPMFGKKHSEEARKKMRDAQQFRAVVAFDADGNIVGEWACMTDAAKAVGAKNSNIWSCCQHKPMCKTCKGYRWEYR